MINLDFTIQLGKKAVGIEKNESLYVDGVETDLWNIEKALTHPQVNSLLEEYQNVIRETDLSFLKGKPVENMIEVALILRKAESFIVKIKERKCIHRRKNTSLDHLTSSVSSLIYHKFDDMPFNRLNFVERLQLADAAEHDFNCMSDWAIEKMYCPIKDSVVRIEKLFNVFKKKQLRNHGNFSYSFVEACETIIKNAEVFRTLRDMAGDDIVNWTDHKVTKRLNDHFEHIEVCSWKIKSLVTQYKTHLIEKGVVPDIKKEINKSKVPNLVNHFDKIGGDDMSQDDLIRVIKNIKEDDKKKVVFHLDYNSLMHLLKERKNTKVMEKVWSKCAGRIIEGLSKKCATEEDFKLIKEACSNTTYLDFSFIYHFKHHFTMDQVREYFYRYTHPEGEEMIIPEDFFDSHLLDIGRLRDKNKEEIRGVIKNETRDFQRNFIFEEKNRLNVILEDENKEGEVDYISKLTKKQSTKILKDNNQAIKSHKYDQAMYYVRMIRDKKFKVHSVVSHEYFKRMTDLAKKSFLKNIHGYLWNYQLIMEYCDLDYSFIRDALLSIRKNKVFSYLWPLAVENRDKGMARHILDCDEASDYHTDWNKIKALFHLVSQDERLEYLKSLKDKRKSELEKNYSRILGDILDDDHLRDFYKWCVDNNRHTHTIKLMELINDGKFIMDYLLTVECDEEATSFERYPVDVGRVQEMLSDRKDVREHLLRQNVTHIADKDFFKDFTREELLDIWERDRLYHSAYKNLIADKMTIEELYEIANSDSGFQRDQVDLLGYDYFKKYKNLFEQQTRGTVRKRFGMNQKGKLNWMDETYFGKIERYATTKEI